MYFISWHIKLTEGIFSIPIRAPTDRMLHMRADALFNHIFSAQFLFCKTLQVFNKNPGNPRPHKLSSVCITIVMLIVCISNS